MSIWTYIVDIATTAAAEGAVGLPVTGAGTLSTQVRIFGFSATTMGETAEAVAHDHSPEIALAAVMIGVGAVALVPTATVATSASALAAAAAPLLGGAISQVALTAIMQGVIEASIAGIAASAAEPALEEFVEVMKDYAWAVGNPGAIIGELPPSARAFLPDWIDDPHDLFGAAPQSGSPLVLDLDGDGVELTEFDAATTTTFFDLNGDGFAEQTAWVSNDDGLLVRDINENGTIDDGNELFGSPTIDGFAKLALLDDNADSIIDQYDSAWSTLRIWQDINDDAVTQEGELLTLASLDIVSIDLAGVAASTSTISGNAISHTSTFRYENGSTDDIVDAWFVHEKANSFYAGDFEVEVDALLLPTLRGFGQLTDLHIAMSENEGLLDLVEAFATGWGFESFADSETLDAAVADILYEWAGVAEVNPLSRGGAIDARRLEFMEEYFAEQFLQWGSEPNPFTQAGATLEHAWSELTAHLKAQLIVQAGGASLFDEAAYNPFTGAIEGSLDLPEAAIDGLVAFATDTGVDTEAYWLQIVDFIARTKGLENVTGTEEGWLDVALDDSGLADTWDDIVETYEAEAESGGVNSQGTSGNDTLNGTAFDDTIDALDGNDTVNAGAGNDAIEGGYGNDILSDGAGGDIVSGWNGADTYIYTSGTDVYSEHGSNDSATDVITLPSGIDANDLEFYRANENSLFIIVAGLGNIEISNFFYAAISEIETIQFYDTSTLDLTAIASLTFYGTDGSDGLIGEDAIDEITYGYGGDDVIWGRDGNNTLNGGAGNDTISAEAGDDTFIFSEGFDIYSDGGGEDTIVIPEEYTMDDVYFFYDVVYGLKLFVTGLGQALLGGTYEHLYFLENASTVDIDTVSVEQRGGDGNDGLNGLTSVVSPDDILNGMGGDDMLQGGSGDDTYIFSEGNDVTFESSGTDTILFWEGWSPNDISIYRGNGYFSAWTDLILEDGDGNKMVVAHQFYGVPGYQVEYVAFSDSTVWDLLTMDIEIWGTSGNDNMGGSDATALIARGFEGNDMITTGTGDDLLDGGDGDDLLYGSAGNDTYLYSGGLDEVSEWPNADGTDTLWITGGVTINDISIADHSAYDAKVVLTASTHEVIVKDIRYSSTWEVEIIKFDDGFFAHLPSYNSWDLGTSGNDTVNGDSSANVLIGYAGNDTINASADNDNAHGGAGNDTLNGGSGNDLLYGGTGTDSLYGDDGADTLNGGDGLDTMTGGNGADRFVIAADTAFNDIDVVADFDITTYEDVLDISDILEDAGYEHGVDTITDWVQITTSGSDSVVKVDVTGTATFGGGTQIATLTGITGLTDEAALASSGNLLLAA